MQVPHIDLSLLPDLDTVTGVFGSMISTGPRMPGHDDSIVILATFVFEVTQGGGGALL